MMESTVSSGAKEQSNTTSAINHMKDKLFLGRMKSEMQLLGLNSGLYYEFY